MSDAKRKTNIPRMLRGIRFTLVLSAIGFPGCPDGESDTQAATSSVDDSTSAEEIDFPTTSTEISDVLVALEDIAEKQQDSREWEQDQSEELCELDDFAQYIPLLGTRCSPETADCLRACGELDFDCGNVCLVADDTPEHETFQLGCQVCVGMELSNCVDESGCQYVADKLRCCEKRHCGEFATDVCSQENCTDERDARDLCTYVNGLHCIDSLLAAQSVCFADSNAGQTP